MLDAATIGRTRFDIDAPGLIDKRVTHFELTEKLNRPWVCEVTFCEKSHDLDLSAMIDEPGLLVIRNAHAGEDTDKGVREIKGLISEIEQGVTGYWWTEYKLRLSPPIARLEHRADSRIFQNMTAQAIIEAVLDDAGVTERSIQLSEAGQGVREYCVQYRETDLDFITRLCAEEGILYSHDVANASKLLMWDNGQARPNLGVMDYNCRPGSWNPDITAFIQQFTYRERVRPGTFSNQDYYFKKPVFRWPGQHGTDHKGMISGGGKDGPLKVYDYGLRNKSNGGDPSNKISQRRLEELRKDAAVGNGISTIPKLCSGTRFELADHENGALNRKYLLVELRHTGRQDQTLDHEAVGDKDGDDSKTEYQNQFLSVPDEVQWRDKFWVLGDQPLKPRVDGPQMATVVGPSGEEIYCDEYGRVKVQFPWDRYGKSDENSSCWVRVSQLWAGAKYGGMAIPRIGHEVIVEHLDGDIDQPIITGRTYHETQKVPDGLPNWKTRTLIKTDTHKGSGYNELRFEDEAGSQEIYLHGEKYYNIHIKDEETHFVGNNRHKEVGVNQSESIGANKDISVGANHTETIAATMSLGVGAMRSTAVGALDNLMVGASRNMAIGGTYNVMVAGSKHTSLGASEHKLIGADEISEVQGSVTKIVKTDIHQEIEGAEEHKVGMTYTLKSSDVLMIESDAEVNLKCGGNFIRVGKSGIEIEGTLVKLNCGGGPSSGTPVEPIERKNPEQAAPPKPYAGPHAKRYGRSFDW